MQIQNNDTIHIPEGFHGEVKALLKTNPIPNPRIKSPDMQVEYLCFFASLIYLKQRHFHGNDENQFVPLSSNSIRQYESGGGKFIKWLCDMRILESTGYQVGLYSKRYRFLGDHQFVPHRLQNQTLIEKIKAARDDRIQEVEDDEVLFPLFKKLKGVEILPDADNWIKSSAFNPAKQQAIIDNLVLARNKDLRKGYFIIQGRFNGRIYTPHSHLPKEIRARFLKIDGEDPMELDLRCSQFQILYVLFKDHMFTNDRWGILKGDFVSEMTRYCSYFQDGHQDLYTLFAEEKGYSREQAKMELIPWLFSSFWQMNTFPVYLSISPIFNKNFPMLFDLIVDFKMSKRNNLAVSLQKFESYVIIESIAIGKLKNKSFSFITIHDSIIVPSSQFEYVKKEIWEPTLMDLGFPQYIDPHGHHSFPEESFSGQVLS